MTEASGAGNTDSFSVVLTSEPVADVTIAVSSGDTGEATVGPASLTFTPANWSTPQDVTVTGVDEAIDDGDQTTTITLNPASVGDAVYDGLADQTVSATTVDDDTAGITISTTVGTVSEGATNDGSFAIVLESQPTGDVTVNIAEDPANPDQCTFSTASVNFTTSNWNVAQTVNVTAVDDAIDEVTTHPCTTGAITASGGGYDSATATAPTFDITDNDSTGVIVTADDGSAEEATPATAGTVGSFLVRLGSQPTGPVTVTLTDDAQCTVTSSLSFDDTNWDTDQTVTVTPIDDLVVEGPHTCAAGSIEANGGGYTAVPGTSPTIDVADNDTAALSAVKSVTETSYSTIGEILHYSILVTNEGNVPLTNVSIDDPLTGDESCPVTDLAVSESTTCTATYMIGAIDIGNLSVSNTASAISDETGSVSSNTVTINYVVLGPSAEAVRDAFGSQAYNYMADRAKLMAANGPTQHRLINRPDGSFQAGSNALNIVGVNGDLAGNFAFNSSMFGGAAEREGVAVVPTGNERVAGGFNVWAEGHFSIYDDESAGSEEGNFFIGHTGADLALTENILVGVMAQLDWMDSRIDDGNTDGTGWMVGPYVSAEVARGVFFDARAMWGQSQNSIRQEIMGVDYHGDFETERWLAEAILSGNLEAGAFSLTPDLRFTYIRENQKGYSVTDGVTTVDVNGQQVDLGQLSVGLKASHLTELDGANVRTYVAGRLFWDIENPGHLTLGGGEVSTDDLRAAITLGLDVATESSRLGLEATYDGLLSDDLDAIGGRVSWTHQF